MQLERGKYDGLAEHVIRESDGKLAVVLVMGGNKGNGLSISCRADQLHMARGLPDLLERMAKMLREQQ